MKTFTLSAHAFKKLERFQLAKGVISTECELFIIPTKAKWKKQEKLLKKLHIDEGKSFSNKLLTISTLIDEKDSIGLDTLVFPEQFAIIDKELVGFVMPFISNTVNMHTLLTSKSITFEEKKSALQKIADILHSIEQLPRDDFFLGDIHESNFIMDEQGKIYAVDLDSCKIRNNSPFPAKFLSPLKDLQNLKDKHPLHTNGLIIPTRDSEWYCYNMIVLNTIANYPVSQCTQSEYYTYLQFLADKGYPKDFLDCVSTLYTACKNEPADIFLESLPSETANANYHILKYQMKQRN